MATEAETAAFLRELGLEGGGGLNCEELCSETVAFARRAGITLPPASGVLCEDPACEASVPLRRDELAALARAELESPEPDAGDVVELATSEEASADKLTWTSRELARSLLFLFDIFVPGNDRSAGPTASDCHARVM